jgi:hypothetical protein
MVRQRPDATAEHAVLVNYRNGRASEKAQREVIRELILDNPLRSNADIARQIGCSHNTVGDVRKELQAACQIDRVDVITGADGKLYPVKPSQPEREELQAVSQFARQDVILTSDGKLRPVKPRELDPESPKLPASGRSATT